MPVRPSVTLGAALNGEAFQSATILLPVVNETTSLQKTVDILLSECDSEIGELILLVCQRTTGESLLICRELLARDPKRISLHFQTLPYLGGALREGFERACGSHVVMMASDLETEPRLVKELICQSRNHPRAIITASRWIPGGGFEKGYASWKYIANFIFQKLVAILFGVQLTDLTFGFRIFPTQLMKSIHWEKLRHPFLLETVLKPLRLGVEVRELACRWRPRIEGESQNRFIDHFGYAWLAIQVRFRGTDRVLQKSSTQTEGSS